MLFLLVLTWFLLRVVGFQCLIGSHSTAAYSVSKCHSDIRSVLLLLECTPIGCSPGVIKGNF